MFFFSSFLASNKFIIYLVLSILALFLLTLVNHSDSKVYFQGLDGVSVA